MNASSLFFFATFSNILSTIPWSLIFFLTQFFNIRLYLINRPDECQRIQKRIGNNTSETGDGGKGRGYSFGRWYFLHIDHHGDSISIWMIATTISYDNLLRDNYFDCSLSNGSIGASASASGSAPGSTSDSGSTSGILNLLSNKRIQITQRSGSFNNPWFRKRSIPIMVAPRPNQEEIIQKVLEHNKRTSHTVVYLHGPPGTGKSMIGLFIAQQTDGTYCNTLKPWQPNDTIDSIYIEIEPTELTPLIIVFDEFDAAIMKIHNGSIVPHKNLPTAVENKTGWNHMLDEIQRGIYPHLILLLTSNRAPEFFNSLDPSYLRSGRVDLSFEMV